MSVEIIPINHASLTHSQEFQEKLDKLFSEGYEVKAAIAEGTTHWGLLILYKPDAQPEPRKIFSNLLDFIKQNPNFSICNTQKARYVRMVGGKFKAGGQVEEVTLYFDEAREWLLAEDPNIDNWELTELGFGVRQKWECEGFEFELQVVGIPKAGLTWLLRVIAPEGVKTNWRSDAGANQKLLFTVGNETEFIADALREAHEAIANVLWRGAYPPKKWQDPFVSDWQKWVDEH